MASYCKVLMVGNLTRDPEMRYTPGGAAVCQFGVAINRKWNDKQSGQAKEEVSFIDCTAWGKTAELVTQYLKKGSQALVEGRLTQDRWDDKQSGQKRSKLYVTVEQVKFLGGRNGQQGGNAGDGGSNAVGVAPGPEEDIPF